MKFFTMTVAAILIVSPFILLAQDPPHPNGGNAPGAGNHKVGGESNGSGPVGDGIFLLIAFSLFERSPYVHLRW